MVAARLHPGVVRKVALTIANAAWRFDARAYERVARNLLPFVDGDAARAKRLSRQVFRSVAHYYVDLLSLPRLDLARFDTENVVIENQDYLETVLAPGPVIVVSAHLGNPELAIQVLSNRGRPFTALVEKLQPRDFAERFLRLRSSGGGHFVESDLAGIRQLLGELRKGGLVGLVADRDIAGTGVTVRVCDRLVRVSSVPWELARRTGATIVPAFSLRRKDGGMVIALGEPFAMTGDAGLREASQRWATEFEHHVRRAPGQWYVLEDFWTVHGVDDAMRVGAGVEGDS